MEYKDEDLLLMKKEEVWRLPLRVRSRVSALRLTFEKANAFFSYDPSTGIIVRKLTRQGKCIGGKEAGGKTISGYREIKFDGRTYKSHRIAWLLHFGEWPSSELDHIDGDGLNNRIANLWIVDHSVNMRNRRKNKNNTSGQTGVCWCSTSGKWHAQVYLHGKNNSVGYFQQKEDAVYAVKDAYKEAGFSDRHIASLP